MLYRQCFVFQPRRRTTSCIRQRGMLAPKPERTTLSEIDQEDSSDEARPGLFLTETTLSDPCSSV